MCKIVVIDALMGTGKTTLAIDMMEGESCNRLFGDDEDEARFVYITPYLDEVERVKKACPALNFVEPVAVSGRKLENFKTLVANRENIASTHALFLLSDREVHDLVTHANYTLIIDEETECVREYKDINKTDVKYLFDHRMVYTDDAGVVHWNHQNYPAYDGRYEDVMRLCDNQALVMVDSALFVWRFPIEFLRMFRRVFVFTYLFEGSLMSAYLKANRMSYEVKTLSPDKTAPALDRMIPYSPELEAERVAAVRPLLTITEDEKLNAVGRRVGKSHPLSVSWFDSAKRTNSPKLKQLCDAAETFFRHRAIGPARERLWTCVKRFKPDLRGKHLTARAWITCNLRATNAHRTKKNLAYLTNVFIHPKLARYFLKCGVEPNHDLHALAALVQWVWRAQIRDGKPVTLFVPSERMRGLLKRWLAGEGASIAAGGEGEEIYAA